MTNYTIILYRSERYNSPIEDNNGGDEELTNSGILNKLTMPYETQKF